EGQGRAKSNDAKRSHAFRREPAQVASLQNESVKNPNPDRAKDLRPRQRLAHKKSANQPEGIKHEPPPKKSRDRGEKISQRREMIKNRMEMMGLELPLLHQVHHAGDTGERERTVSHQRHRGMKL